MRQFFNFSEKNIIDLGQKSLHPQKSKKETRREELMEIGFFSGKQEQGSPEQSDLISAKEFNYLFSQISKDIQYLRYTFENDREYIKKYGNILIKSDQEVLQKLKELETKIQQYNNKVNDIMEIFDEQQMERIKQYAKRVNAPLSPISFEELKQFDLMTFGGMVDLEFIYVNWGLSFLIKFAGPTFQKETVKGIQKILKNGKYIFTRGDINISLKNHTVEIEERSIPMEKTSIKIKVLV